MSFDFPHTQRLSNQRALLENSSGNLISPNTVKTISIFPEPSESILIIPSTMTSEGWLFVENCKLTQIIGLELVFQLEELLRQDLLLSIKILELAQEDHKLRQCHKEITSLIVSHWSKSDQGQCRKCEEVLLNLRIAKSEAMMEFQSQDSKKKSKAQVISNLF